jgi:peptidyl-prolyl cis-trans isomerase SurA
MRGITGTTRRLLFAGLAALVLGLGALAGPAVAQNPFEPVYRINGSVITRYELQQRTLFLTLLNAPSPEQLARDQLVNERLQQQAAALEGVTVPEEEIIAAQSAFAAQGQFDRETFITALGEQGVEEGTFRDFVATGLLWRAAVSQRFRPRAEVTEQEIDRALAQTPSRGGERVLMREILLPAPDPDSEAASLARAQRLSQITDEVEFAAAARQFSSAPSSLQGGEINWRATADLPPEIQEALRGLPAGRTTRPIRLPTSIALFYLRDREEVREGSIEIVSADYAIYLIPGGRSPDALARAAQIAREVRTCDDLYGVALGQPAGVLTRQTVRISELPSDVAREISGLDQYEVSTNLTRGGNLAFLMLCERTVRESTAVDRAAVRQLLTGQRLETFAAGWLNELRLAAQIEELS